MQQRVIDQRLGSLEDVEDINILYRSSLIPSVLMLVYGLGALWLLRDNSQFAWLLGWFAVLICLVALRFITVCVFVRRTTQEQSSPLWRYLSLIGACLSGLALSVVPVLFLPEADFAKQVVLQGLVFLVLASACIAYAMSFFTFLGYAACAFIPMTWIYLRSDSDALHSLGMLTAIYFFALTTAAWQVNRLFYKGIEQRRKKEQLICTLREEQQHSTALNAQLTSEIAKKEIAEQQLLAVQADLEKGVNARTVELQQALHALEKSQERLELALDASQLALWDWDLVSDKILHTRTESIFGLENERIHGVLTDLRPLLHPDDLPVLRNAMIEHLKQRTEGYAVEYRIKHHSGHWVWIEDRGRAIERDKSGRVLRMLGTRRDISARKKRDEELRLASSVFDAGTEGIVILDSEYNILTVNKSFTTVTGYSRAEVLGQNVMLQAANKEISRQYQKIRLGIEQDGSWQGEVLAVRKNGELYPQWLQINVVRNEHNRLTHIVAFFTDLTARRKTEERLSYLTQYDELTGLANRSLFHKRLQRAVEQARKTSGAMALLQIDLDRFKVLNDSLGIEVADQVLRQISRRLSQLLPEAHTVARLGGNEFAVILDNGATTATLARLCALILTRIRLPIEVAGEELIISASIGVSLLPDNSREPASLISQGHVAMQHAKHLGGNNFQFYNDQLQAGTLERLQLEQQLRRAIEEGQLEAYYQPKLSLSDGKIRSAEALVRWNHPQLGLVPPGEFIPLAEETGLITDISELMLLQACEQALSWLNQGMPTRVSVNLSVSHVRQGRLVLLVRQVLQQTGLPAHLLELELTESQLLENADSVIATFKQLREIGVFLAIDDFGTGYSSLSYLKRFPANSVKIDQSFIRDVAENEEDAAITRAIITMAHGLNLLVTAEGVETQAQMDFLKANHCDEIQGYLISRPVPAAQFTEFLISHHAQLMG